MNFTTQLSAADRKRLPLIVCVIVVFVGLLFHAIFTSPAKSKAEGDLKRLEGRASQVRHKPVAPPLSGKSATALVRDVQKLEAALTQEAEKFDELTSKFIPLDDMNHQQALREALTELANASDLEVTLLEQKGLTREEKKRAPSLERLQQLAKTSVHKRPLLRFEARASYRGLMQFLDGLAELPFTVSPVWISVEVETDAEPGQPAKLEWLAVTLDLSM